MHNLFAMAYDHNSTSRLNLKGNSPETKIPHPKLAVNGESLISSPRKYNVSTLRIPADPSWPKIPQRKYAENVGDIIDQPCIVTVTGTPRRSRSIVRTPNSQIVRGTASRETVDTSCYYGSSSIPVCQPMTQPLKRRPGCIDPRFKRVTTVKSQVTSIEPQEHEHETPTEISRSAHVIPNQIKSTTEKVEHSIPEKNTNVKKVIHEETEKPNNAECTESIAIQAFLKEPERKELKKPDTDVNISENCTNCKQNERNQFQNFIEDKSTILENFQEKSGETITKKIPQFQCCNVKTSNSEACKKHETEAHDLFLNDNQCQLSEKDLSPKKDKSPDLKGKFFGIDKKVSKEKIESNCSWNKKSNCQARQISPKPEVNNVKFSERFKTFVNTKAENSEDQIQSDENSISLSEDEIYRNRCNEHNVTDDKESCMPATSDSEYAEKDLSESKIKPVEYYNSAGEDSNFSANDYQQINFFQTHAECFYNPSKKFEISENKGKIEMEKDEREKKGRDTDNFKKKMKSEQDLSHKGRKLCQNSEPRINIKQRRCSTSYSKKIPGYSEEKTDITDSEFNFCWPERHQARRKSNHGYSMKLIQERRNRSCDSGRIDNSEKIEAGKIYSELKKKSRVNVPHPTDLTELKRSSCRKLYQASPQDSHPSTKEVMKNQKMPIISPRADTDITTGKPKAIPIKTQQLLSQSYWEYYNKVKQETCNEGEDPQKQYFCQVAMGAPQIKKKKGDVKTYDQAELSPPEIRTLERCSVLSSMINKTLDSTPQDSRDTLKTDQLFINTNMKSFSDPTAGTPSAVINRVKSLNPLEVYEGSSFSSKSVNKEPSTPVDNEVIKLKTIVFFGILLYAIIVLLPMMYDSFFYEEYDDYEDLTYVEIAFDYVVSSFQEAFAGIFELIHKVMFRPLFVFFRVPVGGVIALFNLALSIILPFRS